jgi:hypothetical protein
MKAFSIILSLAAAAWANPFPSATHGAEIVSPNQWSARPTQAPHHEFVKRRLQAHRRDQQGTLLGWAADGSTIGFIDGVLGK